MNAFTVYGKMPAVSIMLNVMISCCKSRYRNQELHSVPYKQPGSVLILILYSLTRVIVTDTMSAMPPEPGWCAVHSTPPRLLSAIFHQSRACWGWPTIMQIRVEIIVCKRERVELLTELSRRWFVNSVWNGCHKVPAMCRTHWRLQLTFASLLIVSGRRLKWPDLL